MAALTVGLLLFAFACRTEPGLPGCDGLGDPIAREECRYDAVKPLVNDDQALRAAVDSMSDEASRDLLLYRLAVDNPQRAQSLCALTRTPVLREKCDKVIGRPHLAGPPRPSP
ncbi:MAG: hypothetical protein Q8P41_10655 [Pseudomonadota bacterium]|nr:hypothetical protein [Pseudomonadota bacterium]